MRETTGPTDCSPGRPTGDAGLLPPFGSVEVWGLATASDAAYRNLWSYLNEIDLVDQIRDGGSPDRRTGALAAGRCAHAGDGPSGSTFCGCGCSTCRTRWPRGVMRSPARSSWRSSTTAHPGSPAGCYRLRAADAEVECERTDRDPDIQLDPAGAGVDLSGWVSPDASCCCQAPPASSRRARWRRST